MANVTIVYHSGYGRTKVQAEHVLKGLQSVPGVRASLLTAEDAGRNIDQLDSADGIIFGCPTYMGSMSAKMKEFLELASKKWMAQAWKDKLAAGFTNSGGPSGDKLSTLEGLFINAMQHGMVWVGTGIMADTKDPADLNAINRLSSFVGAMAQSAYQAKEPYPGDLKTAEAFGKRVGEAALRWRKGV